MSKNRISPGVIAAGIALAAAVAPQAGAQTSIGATTPTPLPDSALVRTYEIDPAGTDVGITVCGILPKVEGCQSPNAGMGLFGKVGPIIEGSPIYNATTDTVARYIYAVDLAVKGGTGVSLLVYRLNEVVTATDFTVNSSLIKTIPLGLIGGTTAKGFMAADGGFVYIGTDQGPYVIKVAKSGYGLTQLQVSFPAQGNISGITANSAGYVSLNAGSGGTALSAIYDPNGNFYLGPDGTELNTTVGLTPLGGSGSSAAWRMYLRRTRPVQSGTAEH